LAEYPFVGSVGRRGRLAIIADILDVAREGLSKTHIMYKASLSFAQTNQYLSYLLDVKLLEVIENPKKTSYKTTNKGLRYLQSYREIIQLLRTPRD